MSIQVNEMKRMPDPYQSHCMDSFPENYDLQSNYSFTMCQLYCHAQAVASNCSCFWPELYIPTDSKYQTCHKVTLTYHDVIWYQVAVDPV